MGLELVARVSRVSLALLVPVLLASAWIGGASSALGTLAGGLLSLGSLHWLSRGVRNAGAFLAGGRSHPLWVMALALRYAVLFGVVALLLWSGAAHPMGLVAGLSVLPPVLIILGLRAARATV
ncbi:MAG TPA: ATP synthase subunit I [Methylomirabilota bacterium]|nr:ATP synthase subunit I [Methylomirabilota bacterium]